MEKRTVASRIEHLEPCSEAYEWAKRYTSPEKAWAECQRGDWLLWLLGKRAGAPESEARKRLVLCACSCARLALPHTKDVRVSTCIETAEKWAKGETTIEQLRGARAVAYAAYAAEHYAAPAAAEAAEAAYAAAATAYTAIEAAYAAAAAGYAAAYAAAATAARYRVLEKCADIVRKHYPRPPKVTKGG